MSLWEREKIQEVLRVRFVKEGAYDMSAHEETYRVKGFQANGVYSGIKEEKKKDLALIVCSVPAKVTGVFTRNCFQAAPVLLDRERIKGGVARAIVVNSGNANAATGKEGYQDALAMSGMVSSTLRIDDEHVLVASTGIIGRRLPLERIKNAMANLVQGLSEDGIPRAAEAIMTTDKFPKLACRRGVIGGKDVTVCGIAKGAGMIQPNMATMLAFILTDVDIEGSVMRSLFRKAVGRSFNAITVDGCTSTNDTVLLMASGMAGNSPLRRGSRNTALFAEMLLDVMSALSSAIVRDGEGATKVVEIVVTGAKTSGDARKIAYAIGNSNLVKTAFYGGDPNWGRIISAAGAAGVPLAVEKVELSLGDVSVFAAERFTGADASTLRSVMSQERVRVTLNLGTGEKSFCLLASDLTDEYVKINAHYHT